MKIPLYNFKSRIFLILKQYGVKKAGVFGSFVRGDAGKNSDIDILVEFKKGKSLLDLVSLEMELEKILKRKVDVLTYKSIHPLLKDIILKEEKAIL